MIGPLAVRADADQPTPALLAEIEAGRARLDQVLPWLDAEQPDLQRLLLEAAWSRPDWGPAAVKQLRNWLTHPTFSADRDRQLTGLLQTFADQDEVQAVLAKAIADPATGQAQRLQLLQGLARTRLDPLPDAWLNVLRTVLTDEDRMVCQEAVFTVKMKDVDGCDSILRAIGKNGKYPLEIRIAGLECLASRQRACEPDLFGLLREQMTAGKQAPVKVAAARTLGASRLSDAQLAALVEDFSQLPAATISLLLPAFSKSKDAKVGMALVAALERLPGAGVSVGEADRALACFPNEVHVRFRPLREATLSRNRQDWGQLERVARELLPGDVRRGKLVFQSDKAGCTACHRAAGQGGAVGPNLSKIGVIRSHRELLESVLFPDGYVAPEFRTYLAATDRGQIHTGLLLQETTDAIYLRTAPRVRTPVARRQVEDFAPVAASLMPRGFDKVLSRQELSDLIEFLASQR